MQHIWFLIWGITTLGAIVATDMWSYALAKRGWQRCISAFVLFYGQVVATEFLLGIFDILTPWSVLSTSAVLIVAELWVVRRRYPAISFKAYCIETITAIRAWGVQTMGEPLFLVLVTISGALIAWIIFLGLVFPITDYDGNAYHMTFVAQAIQNHNIYDASTSITWLAGYPKGGELIEMWNVIIPHNDLIADLAQLPFLLLGIVSLYAISLRLGIAKRESQFAALLFLFIPVIISQVKTTYVDVIFCGLFFAALALVTQKKQPASNLFLIGIVFSLLISIKSTGLLFVVVCLPFLLSNIVVFKKRRIVPDFARYRQALLAIGPPLVVGIYWYAKDLVMYHSPLYPFGLKIAGVSLFPGGNFQDVIVNGFSNLSIMPPGLLHRVWYTWTERTAWFGCLYNYDATFAGLGPLWFVLLVPAVIVGVVLGIRHRNYLLLSIWSVLGAFFVIYPADFYARYTIFIVLIGVVAFGLLCMVFGETMKTLTKLLAIWLALVVVATSFTMCSFTPAAIRDQLASTRAGDPRGSLTYRNTVGAAYLFLQRRIQPGQVVVYDSAPTFIYPLWRPDLSNKVLYVPAQTAQAWLAGLHRNHAMYVFSVIGSKEYRWIQQYSSSFTSIYSDASYDIYAVR